MVGKGDVTLSVASLRESPLCLVGYFLAYWSLCLGLALDGGDFAAAVLFIDLAAGGLHPRRVAGLLHLGGMILSS